MCRSSNRFRGLHSILNEVEIASSFTGSNIFLFECLICCMPLCRPFVFALSPNLSLFSSCYICFCRTSSSSVAYWNSSLLLPKSLRRNPDSDEQESILEIAAWKRADEYCTFFASKPQVALSRIKQQMHREVGHSNMLQIVRNIRDNMEFLELPGGGTHQPSSETRHSGRAQVDEVEVGGGLISFRDPGHRAGPGGFD